MSDYFEIDFLKVDAKTSGDAIAIRYRIDDETYIHVTDGGYQNTGPELAAHIRKYYGDPTFIDHVVVTHPDRDHARGLQAILEEFDVGTLWMLRPWLYADQLIDQFTTYTSVDTLRARLRRIYPNLNALEEIALARGIEISEPFQGARIGAFSVLAPSPERYFGLILESDKTPESVKQAEEDNLLARGEQLVRKIATYFKAAWGDERFSPEETSAENNMSVVQYASLCDRKILLTGDAGRAALTEAADFAPNVGLGLPGIDRFQVPHHGSRRNVSTEVLDRWLGARLAQQPAKGEGTFSAITSASKDDEDHPRKAVVRALFHRGANVLTTGDAGSTIRTSKNAPDREGWSAVVPLGYPSDMEE